MSEENVEVVRKAIAYEYYGVGDRAEAEAIFDPHVVLNPIDEEPSSGFDAMRADYERWASAFEEFRVTFEEIIDAGDQVVVVAFHQGRGRTSGVNVDTRFYEVYTLREGKVSRVDEYTEREEALEAAGLSEQAMSEENVEILRRTYDLMWREGKIDEAFASSDPSLEFITPGAPQGDVRYGPEAVADFFRDWLDIFETIEVTYEFADAGDDRVVVCSHYRGRAKGSDVETAMPLGQVWTMRDGVAIRCENFLTHQEALEAAGLSE